LKRELIIKSKIHIPLTTMRLLLISNSTNPGEKYLDYPKENIRSFLGAKPVKALFIPYAAVTFSFDEYEMKVSERFREIGHDIVSIHRFSDPIDAVRNAEAIVVGGGNTWQLLAMIQKSNLISVVREKVISGTPYIGWSAGSNVACPTIRTTNDMPIIQPFSFDSFNLIPFQINPHYLDANPEGHAGETREQRIIEFIEANPGVRVVGLREGTILLCENESLKLIGPRKARVFLKGNIPVEVGQEDNLSNFLK
jgi:dipeptidase E